MQREIHLSTDTIAPELRNDFWRAVTRPVFDTRPIADDRGASLEGSITSCPVGPLLIGSLSFSRQVCRRDSLIIARSGLDQYLIQLWISGTFEGHLPQGDVVANPGDILILDLAQPMTSQVEGGSTLAAIVPRSDLGKAVGWRNLHGVVLKAGWPVTRLLADYLVGLSSVATELPSSQALSVQEAMMALIAAGLTGCGDDSLDLPGGINAVLRHRLLAFIDDNLANPSLGPDMLVRQFQLSRAHLYRTFESDGGVATIIRDKRLDLAYRFLIDGRHTARAIKEIAFDCGFVSSSQFIRAFRARFDMTPRVVRQEGDGRVMVDKFEADSSTRCNTV